MEKGNSVVLFSSHRDSKKEFFNSLVSLICITLVVQDKEIQVFLLEGLKLLKQKYQIIFKDPLQRSVVVF